MIVEFDLQTHLVQMEDRIHKNIDRIRTDVHIQTKRIGYLETDNARLTVQVRWLWRLMSTGVVSLLAWVANQTWLKG